MAIGNAYAKEAHQNTRFVLISLRCLTAFTALNAGCIGPFPFVFADPMPVRNSERVALHRKRVRQRHAKNAASRTSKARKLRNSQSQSRDDDLVCPSDTDPLPYSRSVAATDVKERALRNLFQYREPDPEDSQTWTMMVSLREAITRDLVLSNSVMDPSRYVFCCCCGREILHTNARVPSMSIFRKWTAALDGQLYSTPSRSLRTVDGSNGTFACSSCASSLNKVIAPNKAATFGWQVLRNIPAVLSQLNLHERLLISLRLPCIHVLRGRGGYGQYAARGSPVSFSNPVAALAAVLPRSPTAVSDELENTLPDAPAVSAAGVREARRGAQGPLDCETLYYLEESAYQGIEDLDDYTQAKALMEYILRPFRYRNKDYIPSYDASQHLESYFPALFPYGIGGPATMPFKISLAHWCGIVLSVHNSRFSSDLDFLLFINSVLRRRRLSGLAANAPLRRRTTNSILEIRQLLNEDLPPASLSARIDSLLRSGSINASFETLRGSPAFWASIKCQAWAYLVRFGPCQCFITMSVADAIDRFVFTQIDPNLTFDEASVLCSRQRADLLAQNPVAATIVALYIY